jgi:hypothetical protein
MSFGYTTLHSSSFTSTLAAEEADPNDITEEFFNLARSSGINTAHRQFKGKQSGCDISPELLFIELRFALSMVLEFLMMTSTMQRKIKDIERHLKEVNNSKISEFLIRNDCSV